jgi:hypothetical protein
MKRRRFLKLLATIPLALGLRLPVAEAKSEPAWEGYVKKITVSNGGLDAIRACDSPSYEVGCDCNGTWWIYGPDGTYWVSHDMGETWWQLDMPQWACDQDGVLWYSDDLGESWQKIACHDLDDWESELCRHLKND